MNLNTFPASLHVELARHAVNRLPQLIGIDVFDLENAIFDNYITDSDEADIWLTRHFGHRVNGLKLACDLDIALHGKIYVDINDSCDVVQHLVYTCQLEEVLNVDHITGLENVLTSEDVDILTKQLTKIYI